MCVAFYRSTKNESIALVAVHAVCCQAFDDWNNRIASRLFKDFTQQPAFPFGSPNYCQRPWTSHSPTRLVWNILFLAMVSSAYPVVSCNCAYNVTIENDTGDHVSKLLPIYKPEAAWSSGLISPSDSDVNPFKIPASSRVSISSAFSSDTENPASMTLLFNGTKQNSFLRLLDHLFVTWRFRYRFICDRCSLSEQHFSRLLIR